jgi:hypothetical protein
MNICYHSLINHWNKSSCQYNVYNPFIPGNGYITTDVLREILKELDDKITADDLDSMIEEIDSDGSGTVDFEGKYYCKIWRLIIWINLFKVIK